MENHTHFYIDKTTSTFADTLAVFGLARVLSDLLFRQTRNGHHVHISDRGVYYQITCDPSLEPVTVESTAGEPIYPIRVIETPKNAAKLSPDIPRIDYEEEKKQNAAFFEAIKNKVPEEQRPPRPEHWNVLRAINPLTLPGFNSLVEDWWTIRAQQPEVLALLFDLFSATPNNLDAASAAWKTLDKAHGWKISATATCQQLFNPDQGKGQSKTKADGLSVGNVKGFWLVEWLKAVGFFDTAITRTVTGGKDRKTFVVCPRELSYSDSRAVLARFQDTMTSERSTRFDILASIRYTRALLEHFLDEPGGLARLLQLKNVKQRVVAGFQTAFYMDLGNATATMNISFIALPGWVTVESEEDVRLYQALLRELEMVTRQFDESHGDAFELLQRLRDFVSGDDLAAFFRFTNAFCTYYTSKREQGKYVYQLTTWFIERLVMSTDTQLGPILASEGFQNIAYAIRQSTVTAQYRKSQGDRKYDVRYGLGQELARKARYPDAFVAALSDFLHKYNAENAQVMETRSGPYRRSIRTTDIDEIISLIDEFGSETVANLLIAYGYARVSREEESQEPEEESQA